MKSMHALVKAVALLASLAPGTLLAADARRPNVIYVMSDELGYYEPGFMGGKTILTPNLDRMAAEGIRFNNFFGGSSVCAPTRCCFLTGKHSGHTSVRANGGGTPMRADEVTMASMLKPLGYATGGFGKWGCGGRDSTGVPERHGFDLFLGYYDQVHAHTYYPPYLVRNGEEFPLEGNNGGSSGKTEFRGKKGNLYEGGVRIPFIARWPGRIAPGRSSDYLGYFPDILPTVAEVAGARAPGDVDGLSILPELIGEKAAGRSQPTHAYLYWEINGWTAIRHRNWRAVRPPKDAPWELYDLANDPSESKDLAAAQPDVLARLVALAGKAHEPVREGTFDRTDRHERDRRAKYGKQDDPSYEATPGRVRKRGAKPARKSHAVPP